MPEVIAKHPYISIGALLASVAVIFYVNSGGDGAIVSTSDPNAIAAGVALQQSQLQQQMQIAGINASLQTEQSRGATQIALADIQGKYSYDIASLSADVRRKELDTSSQLGALQSTLMAQIEEARINSAVSIQSIQSNQAVLTTRAVADALVAQTAYQSQVAIAAISNQCHGFGCLF